MSTMTDEQIRQAARRLCALRGQQPHDRVGMTEHGYHTDAQWKAEQDIRDWCAIGQAVGEVLQDAD